VTKSRHWSTTFTDLRAARHAWRIQRSSGGQPPSDERTEAIASWEYRGSGYQTAGDAWLAASAAANKLENRRLAWEEQASAPAQDIPESEPVAGEVNESQPGKGAA
jgi:hypothetical protein